MTSAMLKPDTSACPRCGAGFRCAMMAGDAECWCAQLPQVMPVPPVLGDLALPDGSAAACFCPACLKQITDARHPTLFPACD